MASATDPRGKRTEYAYDARGFQTAVTEAAGHALARTVTSTYDPAGNVLSTTDPLGRVTSYAYDALNRRTHTVEAFGVEGLQRTTEVHYDLAGNPLTVIDPLGRMKVREIIQRLKNEGKTVFFSSHELGEVETVCDRVAFLHQGKVRVEGSVSTLMREHNASLEQIFLKLVGYAPATN